MSTFINSKSPLFSSSSLFLSLSISVLPFSLSLFSLSNSFYSLLGFRFLYFKIKALLHRYVPFHASALQLNHNCLKMPLPFRGPLLNPLDSIFFPSVFFVSWSEISVSRNEDLKIVWRLCFYPKWRQMNFRISFSGVEMTNSDAVCRMTLFCRGSLRLWNLRNFSMAIYSLFIY